MTVRFIDHLLYGDHASRPAAAAVPEGTLYSCTDHSLIYQSDAVAWVTYATLGGAPPPPPAAGALELVESHDFGAAATSYTFSGLDGDTAEVYQIQYRIIDPIGGSFFTVQPNALTTNQKSKRQYFGAFAGGGTDTNNLALCDPNAAGSGGAGDIFSGHGWLYAKTGLVRLWQCVGDWYRAGDSALFGVQVAGYWTDTAANITSLAIVSNTANAIGAGSFVRLYKLNKV